jgi:hypothetical protein
MSVNAQDLNHEIQLWRGYIQLSMVALVPLNLKANSKNRKTIS